MNNNKNPNNSEAESGVLGALLLDQSKYPVIAEIIKDKTYFYYKKNQRIYSAITGLYLTKEPVDVITLAEVLHKDIAEGLLKISEISELVDLTPTAEHCEYYAKIVRDKWQARQLQEQCHTIIGKITNNEKPREIWDSLNEGTRKIFFNENDTKYDLHNTINKLYNINNTNPWGVSWNYPILDDAVGQIDQGNIVILAGRPSHGKTALALQLIDGWLGCGHKILFESLEMTQERIDMRRLSRISKVPLWIIKQGLGSNPEIDKKINDAATVIFRRQDRLIIRDKDHITAEEVVSDIRMAHDKIGIDFLILDHFHKMKFLGQNENRAMADGLELIVAVCKELKITCIILAHLNRGLEREDNREPKLSDLRQCGRLEENADIVLFLHWKYKFTGKEEDKLQNKILCAKNRDGKTGRIMVAFTPEIFKFENHEIIITANNGYSKVIQKCDNIRKLKKNNSFLNAD